MRNHLPCKYKDYIGSRWYSRLVFDEFHIQFDQYPDKEIIIDKIAQKNLSKKNLDKWYHCIRNYWIENKKNWSNLSPLEFIYSLRTLRQKLFNISYYPYKKSSLLKYELDLTKLEKGEYQVILDGSDLLSLDEQIKLFSREDCKFSFYISNEYKDRIHNQEIKILNNPGAIDILELQNLNIISLDIWYCYLLNNENIFFYCFIDNREWFTSLIINKAQKIDSNLKIPKNIDYNKILTNVKCENEYRELLFIDKPIIKYSNGAFLKKPIIRDNNSWLDEIYNQKNIKEITGFFVKKDNKWCECDDNEKNKKFVSLLLIPEKEVIIKPVFFKKMTSPLSLSFKNGGLFTSFNYYFTDNLKQWYSKYDCTKLNWDNFLLDYLFINEKQYETILLYNKALIGCTKNGELFYQPSIWDSINCQIGEYVFSFDTNNIDEKNQASIYFPNEPDEIIKEDGSIFITIVQDYIWKIQKDSSLISPFGVVIKVNNTFDITQSDNVKWEVNWLNKKYDKEDWAWMIGGFNSLIIDGHDLMDGKKEAQSNLKKEGWFIESSKLTQETQLLNTVEQPRSFLGKVGSNIIIGSIIGRYPFSQGATFSEESSLVQSLISKLGVDEKIDFLFNLDGGASSVLGAKKDGEENIIIIPPSASATNCAGIPRMVPSTLQIEFI